MDSYTKSRRHILDWGVIEHLGPMILIGEDGYPNDGADEGLEAVAHIQSCQNCKLWLHDFTSAEVRERMDRLSKYCCPNMFASIEEPEPNPRSQP